jgi:hypothetical protein
VQKSRIVKVSVTGAVLAAAGAAMFAFSVPNASADTTANAPAETAAPIPSVEICADGDFAAYVKFPDRGNMASVVVDPGECKTVVKFTGAEGDKSETCEVIGQIDGKVVPLNGPECTYNTSDQTVIKAYGGEGKETERTFLVEAYSSSAK